MGSPAGKRLRDDPRVAEAKRLLREAVAEHSAGLDAVRPPDPALADGYRRTLGDFAALRGGNLYYPYLGSGAGSGAWVELADGSVKLDLINGIGPHAAGHSNPRLIDAAIDAAIEDVVMQGNLQQNAVSVDVCRALLDLVNAGAGGFAHCFLTTSGAMANENALKLAFHRRAGARRLLAFERCFAGRTLATAWITDKAAFREGIPETLAVDRVPFFDADDPRGSTDRALAALRAHCDRHRGDHAAMMFEMVQGEGGYWPGEREFFRALMGECRDRGISVIVDEVQTFGRTEQAFACRTFGCDDLVDAVTVGKMTQVCATLFRAELRPKPGLISQTFTGATAALHASRAILARLTDGDLFGPEGRVAAIARRFAANFEAIAARRPGLLRGPWGVGALVACTPLDGDRARVVALAKDLFARGLICFVAGGEECRLRFLPAILAIRDVDIDSGCAILEDALVAAEEERSG